MSPIRGELAYLALVWLVHFLAQECACRNRYGRVFGSFGRVRWRGSRFEGDLAIDYQRVRWFVYLVHSVGFSRCEVYKGYWV